MISEFNLFFIDATLAFLSIGVIFNIIGYVKSNSYLEHTRTKIKLIADSNIGFAGLSATLLVIQSIIFVITFKPSQTNLSILHLFLAVGSITSVLIFASCFYILRYGFKQTNFKLRLIIILVIAQCMALYTYKLANHLTANVNSSMSASMSSMSMNMQGMNMPSMGKTNKMNGMDMSKMDMSQMNSNSTPENKSNASKKPLYWIDPMAPQVHYSKPGKSAMGMQLVPVYANQNNANLPPNSIKLAQGYIDNLGVVTIPVASNSLNNPISTYAIIESDENKISYITLYADGWIKNLNVKSVGTLVKKGQLLAQIFAPSIVNAEEEYILAIQSNNKVLADAAVKKLHSLHMADLQINQLEKTKTVTKLINIYASENGVVTALNAREGDYITLNTKIFTIIDLSQIWLIASVFEKQAGQVKINDIATAKFDAYPNQVWQGKVEYIYPQLDTQTRSLKVRLRFNNPDIILKPGMYGNITISTSHAQDKLTIPSQSVIYDPNGNKVVVALGNGIFQVRRVVTGEENNGQVEIISGLSIGESVVKSGEFMIDSEANLDAALDQLSSSGSSN